MTTAKKTSTKRSPARKTATAAAPPRWRITWGDKSWTDEDLTGLHMATLALISGDDRFQDLSITPEEIAVYPALGYMRLINLLRTFATIDALEGVTDEDEAHRVEVDVLAGIQRATKNEILDSLGYA